MSDARNDQFAFDWIPWHLMRRTFLRIVTAIQLTRLTMAFGAVSDLWFVILLTKYDESSALYSYLPVHDMPLAIALLAGLIVALGLFAYGASLNDVLDVRHDSAFSPGRPIPAGRIRMGQAIVVTVGALLVAMLGGVSLGKESAGVTLLAATAILFYNAAGKYVPAVGVVVVGLIHATHLLIPNPQLEFTLPAVLVMTHAMVIAALVHQLEQKRPRLGVRSISAIVLAWLCWTAILVWAGARHGRGIWPDEAKWTEAFYPIVAVIGFALVGWWKATGVQGVAAAEKLKRYGAMWQALYGAAWLMAFDLREQALWIGGFAVVGFTAMTLIKEITGLSDRPVAYR